MVDYAVHAGLSAMEGQNVNYSFCFNSYHFLFAVLSKSIKLFDFAYEDAMELKDYLLIVDIVYWPLFSLRTK